MYQVRIAPLAKRAIKKLSRSGRFDVKEIFVVIHTLREGNKLDASYRDHQLKGAMRTYRECHLAFDLLLVYEIDMTLNMLIVANIGTHEEIFD